MPVLVVTTHPHSDSLDAPEVDELGGDGHALGAQPQQRHLHARGGAHIAGSAYIGEVAQLRQHVAHAQQPGVALRRRQVQCGICSHLRRRATVSHLLICPEHAGQQ